MASICYRKRKAKKARIGYTWEYTIRYKGALGKTKTVTKAGFATKAKATKAALQRLVELESGKSGPGKKTVNEIWEKVWNLEIEPLRENTKKSYDSIYRRHICPVLGDVKVGDLDYVDLQQFLNTFSDMSNAQANVVRILLNKVFSYAIKTGEIGRNPLRDCKSVYAEKAERLLNEDYINQEEFKIIYNCLEEYPGIQTCLMLCYYLGLRMNEALGLCWKDIDFNKREVFIHQQNTSTSMLSEKLKTRTSRALLPICPPLYDYLIQRVPEDKSERCCLDPDGKPWTARRVRYYLNKFVPFPFHIHQLRHSFITNIVQVCDPKTAAVLARHSSVKTTLEVYTEVTQERKKEVINLAFSALNIG